MQSVTIKHSRSFSTPLGRFEFSNISREAFPIGVTSILKDGYAFLIATPEKALCDLIAGLSKVNLRYLKDAAVFLEDDLRMDMDAFFEMNPLLFEDYAAVGKKSGSVKTLIRFLRQGQ